MLLCLPLIVSANESILEDETAGARNGKIGTERTVSWTSGGRKDPNKVKVGTASHMARKDSLAYIKSLIKEADTERAKGNFDKLSQILWKALPNAEQINDLHSLISIHNKLGNLYSMYRMDSISFSHKLTALELSKALPVDQKANRRRLSASYLTVANHYKWMGKYESALQYLDSCYLFSPIKGRLHHVDAAYGQIYVKKGELDKAQSYLQDIIPHYEKHGISRKAMFYFLHAELKSARQETDSALYFYEKCLYAIDSFQVNQRFKPWVLQKLAHHYFERNEARKAFVYLKQAKSLSDSMSSAQAKYNKFLFEVNDKYKEDLEKKNEVLDAQEKMLKLKDQAGLRLKLIFAISFLLALIGFFALRLQARLKGIVYQQNLEKEKNKAILEVKNKELAASTLQIIEKENIIKDLLGEIQESRPEAYLELNKSFRRSNQKLWDDFHLRFTQINSTFYDNLHTSHPELTPTDLKHCALIKLNFDSKEMAQILGISLHSVHVSRSRIRKKLGLARQNNLSNYINSL